MGLNFDIDPEDAAHAAMRLADAAVRTKLEADLPVVLATLFDSGIDDEEEGNFEWKRDLQTSLKKVRSSIV